MYRTMQVSLDGAYIFDYSSDSKEKLWEAVNEQGSKWFFYPLPFIVKNEYGMNFQYKKIIDAPYGFEFLRGKTIRKAIEYIKKHADEIQAYLQA